MVRNTLISFNKERSNNNKVKNSDNPVPNKLFAREHTKLRGEKCVKRKALFNKEISYSVDIKTAVHIKGMTYLKPETTQTPSAMSQMDTYLARIIFTQNIKPEQQDKVL